jgi:type IV pilus assembly protein PilF
MRFICSTSHFRPGRARAACLFVLASAILIAGPGCRGGPEKQEGLALLYRLRAEGRLQANDTVEAGRILAQAEKLDPDSGETQVLIGEVFRREGNQEEAEARYRRALALKPDLPEAHLDLGLVLAARGRLEEAIREFRIAALNPDFANRDLAYDNIGQLRLEQEDLDGAERAFREAVAFNDRWPQSQAHLGKVLYLKGDLLGAAESLARAIRLDPKYVEARYRLALTFIRMGRRAEAVAELRSVVRLAPEGPFAKDAREQLALLE